MMNADQYRAVLHRRMNLFSGLWLGYLLLMAGTRFAPAAVTGHPAYAGMMGFMVGGLLVTLLGMKKYRQALKDDTALRRLYNQEKDERMQAIRAKAGVPVTLFMGMGMMAAGLVATFFSMTVALTLIASGLVQLVMILVLKVWYMRTM